MTRSDLEAMFRAVDACDWSTVARYFHPDMVYDFSRLLPRRGMPARRPLFLGADQGYSDMRPAGVPATAQGHRSPRRSRLGRGGARPGGLAERDERAGYVAPPAHGGGHDSGDRVPALRRRTRPGQRVGRLNVAAAVGYFGRLAAIDKAEPNDDAGARSFRVRRPTVNRTASLDFWDDQNDVYAVRLRRGGRLVAS